jgi:MFS transporter, OFA family, oxalate/formate antiporter
MSNLAYPAPRNKIFYGWIVILACFSINAVIHGIRYSFGVFFKSLSGEFVLSRTATAGISSVYWVLCAVFGLVGGILMDKAGPRKIMFPMGLITALSLIATSQAAAGWQLYFTYSLILSAGTGAVYSVLMTTAQRWFHKRRGTAVGIVSSGVGVGTLIMTPLTGWLIDRFTWRPTYLGLGIITGMIIVGFTFLLRRDPAGSGLQPDGIGETSASAVSDGRAGAGGMNLSQAFRNRNYWLLAGVWILWSFSLMLIMTHLVPYMTDTGITMTTAALVSGLIGLISIPGRLSSGWISDHLGRKPTILIALILQAIALWLLAWSHQIWLFYIFAILFGLGYGGLDPVTIALIGDIFGVRNLGRITGTLTFFWALGACAGSTAGGLIYDSVHSYFPAFILIGVFLILATGLAALIQKRS